MSTDEDSASAAAGMAWLFDQRAAAMLDELKKATTPELKQLRETSYLMLCRERDRWIEQARLSGNPYYG